MQSRSFLGHCRSKCLLQTGVNQQEHKPINMLDDNLGHFQIDVQKLMQ